MRDPAAAQLAPPPSHRRVLAGALVAAAAGLLLYLPLLGASDLVGDDEVLDAGIVRAMAEEGEWVYPRFNGEPIPKPPLFYWSAAATARVLGFDERAVRLPSALFAAATIAATVVGGAALVGEAPAILGGLLLAVMPVFYDQARLGRADMTMTFFVTAALLLVLSRPGELRGRARIAFFALVGLATLAKGSAGAGVVVAVLAGEALFGNGLRILRPLVHPTALVAVLVASSWYLLALAEGGRQFVQQNVLGENLRHLIGGGFVSGDRGWAFHLTHFRNVLTGTMPWGLFLPAALLSLRTLPPGERRDGALRLTRWLASGLVFFTIAARKSPYYLLPAYPAVALLVGAWVWQRTGRLAAEPAGFAGRLPLAAAGVALAVLAAVAAGLRLAGIEVAELDAFLATIRERPVVALVAVAFLPVAAVAFLSAARSEWRTAVPRLWLAAFLALLLAQRIEPALARDLSMRGFAEAVRREAGDGDLFFFLRPARAVAFYAGREIATLPEGAEPPPAPFWLIVRGPFWEELPESWRERSRIVAAGEGRVVTSRKMKILLIEVGAARDHLRRGSPEPLTASTSLRSATRSVR